MRKPKAVTLCRSVFKVFILTFSSAEPVREWHISLGVETKQVHFYHTFLLL